MKLYSNLSKVKLFKNYSTKFLAIAFLGIHIPLIGLILFLDFTKDALSTTVILSITLLFTLGASTITLSVLNKLLDPIKLASGTVKSYLESQALPNLPTHFNDEVGELLRDLQYSIKVFDNLIDAHQQTIAILSHDLRNQCSGILMSLELIEDVKDENEKQDILSGIKTLATEQMSLMENTLANLKNESKSQGKLEKKDLDLKELIKQVIASFELNLKDKNIDLSFKEIEAKSLHGNETALRQVFANLISNAIKFSPEGGKIWIKTKSSPSAINIDVIDQGLGFEPKVSEALFKPFTDQSRSGSKGEASHGMGLFLSRRFINKHFGKLIAHSEGPNQGATFSVQLPIK